MTTSEQIYGKPKKEEPIEEPEKKPKKKQGKGVG